VFTSFFRLWILCILCFTQLCFAQQSKQIGSFEIHYNVFPSTFLTPKIATLYGFQRSQYSSLLNISVIDTRQSSLTGVSVIIEGSAKNLIGQPKSLVFQKIDEGDAIYYIAPIPHRNQETLTFDIHIKYQNQLNTQLTFQKSLYVQ
jgi:hypothetical protein